MEAAAAGAAGLAQVPHVEMGGKTDPQILRDIFLAAAVPERDIPALLHRAIAEAVRLLAEAKSDLRAAGHVLPGIAEVLPRLDERAGVRQSTVTGNLAANALVKLSSFGLIEHLDTAIGAFGSDHHDRERLVPIALGRAARLRGDGFDPGDVWVVGDTPHDLACAQAAGVRCLLVATGAYALADLEDLAPDVALPDLGDVESVVAILSG